MERRTDETGFGNIRVIQNKGTGYGIDSVLLAAFAAGETGAARIRDGSRAADLGTGCGIIAFILAHKIPDLEITGIDVNEDAVERAREACFINRLTDRVSFIASDVNDITNISGLDAVVSNPPYFRRRETASSGEILGGERYIARHETTADIGDFAAKAADMLRDGGSLYLVHRPERLADIVTAMRSAGIEPREIQAVVPRRGEDANIVLVRGVKGARADLRLLPEIAVREADGGYTGDILRFYERGPRP